MARKTYLEFQAEGKTFGAWHLACEWLDRVHQPEPGEVRGYYSEDGGVDPDTGVQTVYVWIAVSRVSCPGV